MVFRYGKRILIDAGSLHVLTNMSQGKYLHSVLRTSHLASNGTIILEAWV